MFGCPISSRSSPVVGTAARMFDRCLLSTSSPPGIPPTVEKDGRPRALGPPWGAALFSDPGQPFAEEEAGGNGLRKPSGVGGPKFRRASSLIDARLCLAEDARRRNMCRFKDSVQQLLGELQQLLCVCAMPGYGRGALRVDVATARVTVAKRTM